MNPEVTQRRFEDKQEKPKMFYDRNAKTRASISDGDHILLRKNMGDYQSAVVIMKEETPRSYNVRTKDGAIYRRTSRHLKKPRHYAGEVPRMSAPEALRYEIPSKPQLVATESTRRSTCGGRSRSVIRDEQSPVAPNVLESVQLLEATCRRRT